MENRPPRAPTEPPPPPQGEAPEGVARPARDVRLVRGGLRVGGAFVPLTVGSVHYWRLDPRDWRACLLATKALGLRLIDTYIPWAVHEVAPGQLELGEGDPQRDVGAFLRLAHELGLYVIVRPGPHINAELTGFGIPERVLWDPACQARSPRGNPVMLPMLPFAFPVPSYASAAFLDEATRYFRALAPVLSRHVYPEGPIVLVQIDNEGALYFRDGAYDQDYHPDAVALYRDFLRDKYKTLDALQAAYGGKAASPPVMSVTPATPATPVTQAGEGAGPGAGASGASGEEPPAGEEVKFATLVPPVRFDAETPAELGRHLDWSEFHEHLLANAFARFGKALAEAGLSGLPTSHNLPLGQEATPLNAARVTRAVDLVGLDYYHAADAGSRVVIARRTSELSVRCDALGLPAFACELGAGYPPFFPPLEERDSAFTVLAALAYGLRGFNVYMAVERDRWIGAPIDRHGRPRPFAAFWTRLSAALEETSFYTLRRRAPVRLMIPRSERRLTRVMHAFGPLTGAVFSVLGAGARERVSEQDLGLGYPLGIEADSFARVAEAALEARGVPFAHVGGEDREAAVDGAAWVLCATSGGMHPGLFAKLAAAAQAGTRVTLGPRAPAFDGAMRPLAEPLAPELLRVAGSRVPVLLGDDPAAAQAAVAAAIEELGLPTYACDPEGVFATVHEDDAGAPRVLFLLNPGEADVVAQVTVAAGVGRAVDLLEGEAFASRGAGTFEVRMKPRTVRMLALS